MEWFCLVGFCMILLLKTVLSFSLDEAAHLIENQKDLMKRHEVDIREVKALKKKYGEYAWAEKLDYLTSEVFDNLSGKSQLEIFNRYMVEEVEDNSIGVLL